MQTLRHHAWFKVLNPVFDFAIRQGLFFEASPGRKNTCQGTTIMVLPHDMNRGKKSFEIQIDIKNEKYPDRDTLVLCLCSISREKGEELQEKKHFSITDVAAIHMAISKHMNCPIISSSNENKALLGQ